jgi:hypothetical protein
MKEISGSIKVDLVGLDYRVKSKESFLRKVDTDSRNSVDAQIISDTISTTNDVIRYTFQDSHKKLTDSYFKAIDALAEKGYTKVKVKNTWNKYSPYKGINTIFKSPDGQNFEIQFHTPESFKLKDGELHKLYEEWRLLPEDTTESKALRKQMFELSQTLTVPKNIEKVR